MHYLENEKNIKRLIKEMSEAENILVQINHSDIACEYIIKSLSDICIVIEQNQAQVKLFYENGAGDENICVISNILSVYEGDLELFEPCYIFTTENGSEVAITY